jgi:hypothetical protein
VLIQGAALWRGDADGTLSAHTRRALGVYPHRPWRRVGVAGLVALCVWLPMHITMYEAREIHHG